MAHPTSIGRSFDLSGRTALVTGGSRGLGKAMARGLAEAGADILIASRHEAELVAAVADIGQGLQSRVQLAVTDLGRRGEVERLATRAVEVMGRIDILLDDAAMFPTMPLAQLTDEIWDQTLQVNLTASLELARALAPGMIERRWGRIIHVSSVSARVAGREQLAYAMTKAAACAMIRDRSGPTLTQVPVESLKSSAMRPLKTRPFCGSPGSAKSIASPRR